MKIYNGIDGHVRVGRYKCSKCGKLHTGLPEQLVPHKHYAAEVIENAVDGIVQPGDPQTENYPCEGTFKNWKRWMDENKDRIDGSLKSIGSKLDELGTDLLESSDSLLTELRKDSGWLSTVCRVIYNSALSIPSLLYLPSCPPDSVCVTVLSPISSAPEEKINHESSQKTGLAGRRSTPEIQTHLSASRRKARYRQKEPDP